MTRLCTTIAHIMINLVLQTPLPERSATRWQQSEHSVRLNPGSFLVLSTSKAGVQRSEPYYL